MYMFIPLDEYEEKFKLSNPEARISPDGKEVVISCEEGMNKDEARQYIAEKWS
jgi:hypothetical protein